MPSPLSGASAGSNRSARSRWSARRPPARPAWPRPCSRRGRDRHAGQRSSAAPRSATSTRWSGACSTRSTRACCTSTHGGTRVHLIDTPGAPDFLGQSLPALEAVETAAVVVNAATGIEPMARAHDGVGRGSAQRDRLIIVNKIDAAERRPARRCWRRSRTRSARSACRSTCPARRRHEGRRLLLQPRGRSRLLVGRRGAPRARRPGGRGRRGLRRRSTSNRATSTPRSCTRRSSRRCARATWSRCASSPRETGAGVAELLDIIVKLLPQPGRGQPAGVPARARAPTPSRCAAAPDPRQARARARVQGHASIPSSASSACSACTRARSRRTASSSSATAASRSRSAHLFMLQGKDHVEVAQALPGDIGAVAKVDEIALRRGAARRRTTRTTSTSSRWRFPMPMHGLAIEPKRHGDEQRHVGGPAQAGRRGPVPELEHVAGTNETVLYGLGDLHLRVLLERLRETVHASRSKTRPPRIAYRETITAPAEGHHRHKKQTGGAGQFGEVFLRIEPLPRGTRLRVRRRGQGRRDSRPVHPGGGEGRARRCWTPAPSPATRCRTCASSSTTASTTASTPRKSRSSPPARKAFLDGDREGAADRARADRATSRSPRPSSAWATSPATSRRGAARSAARANGAPGTMTVRGQAPMSELHGYQIAAERADRRPGPLHASSSRTTSRCRRTRSSSSSASSRCATTTDAGSPGTLRPSAWCRRTAGRS